MELSQLIHDVKDALTPHRFRHVEGVVQASIDLAKQYGVCVEQAEIAAWLHDIAREWSWEKLRVASQTIEVPPGFATIPTLLHGPIGAHIGKTHYGIDDELVLDAVRYHTTGRPDMTALDMVLFVADAIEPGRDYAGVEDIREAARRSLESAVRLSIDNTIRFLVDAGKPLFPLTVLTRNDLIMRS
ncbi:bis(5'-nucleosyl)-tetraphosphatase (symmetrical) YqeK [Alicyclobacillus fastidiosus]|uniref:bis(5'-nucleosyl)-tetraphosphatase (symmetrical) n=1 Tax=Alicyclobacillus fastidiosus TaxID=392011 RepID=A0ABV5AEA8_9BACL|nr:bis(5'-nucleosyl)-tetraphosphatase (symmetrical) YqeK [Alicyclobacillus fastidiosus]WEH11316.1 bis(5'-nucleosyl)-tetraphosphatase (symmetrical) YqeK [Alicyclobacillus fastidiosus]